ncbi:MAG: hypothetical protein ACMVY4_19435 [Minwuia sp.]|uniref:hypothetical protein n=1 Tax=Minwuia sp. TaxID=2493630 RepID=UPI003A892B2C
MRKTQLGWTAALLTVIAVGVSSCGLGSAAFGTCPKIGVLPDAADKVILDNNGQLLALARLSTANSPCAYDKTDTQRTGYSRVSFTLTVRSSAARNQGAQISRVDTPYVVATVAPDGTVTGKQNYDMTVSIDGQSGFEEDRIQIRIPYEGGGEASQYRVVVGYQLDRAAVEQNRSRLGR